MKRFHSPLQKIHRIQQQQLKLAEIALLRAQAAVRESEQRICEWNDQILNSQNAITALIKSGQSAASGNLDALRSHPKRLQHDIKEETLRQDELRRQLAVVQSEYQRLSARCSGMEEILQKKLAEHRRAALLAEQVQLEELFTARNMNRAERSNAR